MSVVLTQKQQCASVICMSMLPVAPYHITMQRVGGTGGGPEAPKPRSGAPSFSRSHHGFYHIFKSLRASGSLGEMSGH